MNKSLFSIVIILFLSACFCSCNNPSSQKKESVKKKMDIKMMSVKKATDTSQYLPATFYYSLEPSILNCRIPALQSFVFGQYNGLWIFIGGEKKGFHGTDNDPPPFRSKVANDSIWVIDINHQQSWSIAVPSSLSAILSATNSAYCQVGNLLYLCGGFTKSNPAAPNFNYTSNIFLEIDLSALVSYVQNGGNASLSSVITKQIQDPFVQVTGGALVYNNGFFYLIGGQNYSTTYNSGTTGAYTNAIRKFTLQQQQSTWVISDTASLIDTVNLHRRDMNVVPGPPGNDQGVILYGGVFTKKDEAFRNAVFINGLSTGNPSIMVDSMQQNVNQYSCATATFSDSSFSVSATSFFGGITYKMFDKSSGKLVVGDHGVPMPFSNIASTIVTGGGINNSLEFIQIPPNSPLLPGFIGANAIFIPVQQFALAGNPMILDVNKINADSTLQSMVGYIFGGIVSMGPTSGTTPKGFVPTYANPIVYQVYLNFPGVH
ncbi:hypothetical protein FRZ67_16985 [Panacibacter ginsenosidivorans]|uniref:Uncharacterized protein n=1 Tax=Panacibacter ginsenosidivorans TaxID=1813871 RepID=A0A5B8VD79_9BACT|nr:hypothetical protein [Panacibacter ginsenosidivorans]QEC68921.1 hypothetical protein FRZ67_16985 [Panacibacter ginsenosidivorans]